jgi:anthranilate phosphoribosyltransferase
MILRDLLKVLGSNRRDGRNLNGDEAFRAFQTILDGSESEVRIGAFLIALRWKGVTVEELVGFARAARAKAVIPCQGMDRLVCLCPPHDGFDRHAPLEVVAGLIAAASGVRVLVIADRCVPPKRGLTAASVLERLDAAMTWDPSEAEAWVEKASFAAISATGMLPALLGLRRVRGDLGVRTALSTVEKLITPSSAAMLAGASSGPVLGAAVEVIQGLGHKRGIVVQGLEGGVIPSAARRTRGIELIEQRQVPLSIEPNDWGLQVDADADLPLYMPSEEGQGAADNPGLVKASTDQVLGVLAGEMGAARNAALLGAGLVLKAGGACMTLADGVDRATSALDSGAASAVLAKLRELARRHKG